LSPICEELMDYCLAEKGNISGIGCDNMTVVIVAFLRKRRVQDWYDWMASKACPELPVKKADLLGLGTPMKEKVEALSQVASPPLPPSNK
jgi:protein phosphatase 2C family protein 2/3